MPTAVIARNLMRELEAFMPLQAVLSAGAIGPGAWGRLALTVWLVFLALLPFFNRDRLRGGDILAGTMVIAMPKRRLLDDLVEGAVDQSFPEPALRAYGAFELQILEELLRRPANAETTGLQRDVCQRICRKIGWTAPVPPSETAAFLHRFYTAQRAFLEREQRYGRQVGAGRAGQAPQLPDQSHSKDRRFPVASEPGVAMSSGHYLEGFAASVRTAGFTSFSQSSRKSSKGSQRGCC